MHAATSDVDEIVRASAVDALGKYWLKMPEVKALLYHSARTDSSENIRMRTIRTLAEGCKTLETFQLLCQRAKQDSDEHIRKACVAWLNNEWLIEEPVFPLLVDRIQNDACNDLRRDAILGLIKGWRDRNETLPLLLERAALETDTWVRRTAIKMLQEHWPQNPKVVAVVLNQALNGEWGTHEPAWTFARKIWKEQADYLPFMRQLAKTGKNEYVRQSAIEALEQDGPGESTTLELLSELAKSDQAASVRWAALRAWRRLKPGDPKIRDFCLERIRQETAQHLRRHLIEKLSR
jgi:HEAT repeat protein